MRCLLDRVLGMSSDSHRFTLSVHGCCGRRGPTSPWPRNPKAFRSSRGATAALFRVAFSPQVGMSQVSRVSCWKHGMWRFQDELNFNSFAAELWSPALLHLEAIVLSQVFEEPRAVGGWITRPTSVTSRRALGGSWRYSVVTAILMQQISNMRCIL